MSDEDLDLQEFSHYLNEELEWLEQDNLQRTLDMQEELKKYAIN